VCISINTIINFTTRLLRLQSNNPLVLHPADSEYVEFHTLWQKQVPSYILEAMTKLVVLDEIAEPSFLLMINWVE
jgi:hypothetical protein